MVYKRRKERLERTFIPSVVRRAMKSENARFLPDFLQFRFKRKYLIYLSLINFAGLLVLVYDPDFYGSFRADSRGDIRGQHSHPDHASMRTNIFFLKTHKAAGSTVQNVFLRFGLRHSLNFLLPERGNYLGYSRPIENADVGDDLTPPDDKFNIFAHHSRYNRSTNRYLYGDTVHVTILRYPPRQFESGFHFFGWDRQYNVSLSELLKRMPQDEEAIVRRNSSIPLYNRMSYDLGLERSQMRDERDIREFVNYIDDQFDYVMITEYMEASLVMLAGLMGWPLDYVATLPLMRRAEFPKNPLTRADELKLSALNGADTALYHHFLKKFRERILDYGLTELTEDIQKLRRINEALVNRCIDSTDRSGYGNTLSYKLRDPVDWECNYTAKSELPFTDAVRLEQIARLRTIKKIHKLVNSSSSSGTSQNYTPK